MWHIDVSAIMFYTIGSAPAMRKHPGAWLNLHEKSSMIDSIPHYKTCKDCSRSLPATTEYFSPCRKGDKVWLASYCKPCTAARTRIWNANNPERSKARANQWYQENKEQHRANARRWAAANVDKVRAITLKCKWKHIERSRAYSREYARNHREQKKEADKNRKANNPERAKELSRLRYQRNRDTYLARTRNYRARKREAAGTHTAADTKKQYTMQKGLCWWCSYELGQQYHVDHRIPLARGGSNGPENIVISCPSCNTSRRDKLPHECNGRLF